MTDLAPDLINPHEPGPECGDLHCYWHHVDEPDDGAYRVCFECKHVYRTAEDLRAAFMAEVMPCLVAVSAPPIPPPPVEEIYACVFCCHDW